MAYIAPADFRELTQKAWTAHLLLTEEEATDAYITSCIALVTSRIEADLGDDFEPPTPDNDETLLVDGSGRSRLYIPRRVRSLTTVETQGSDGVFTAQGSTLWRLHKSLNAAGTAMADGSLLDWLDVISALTTVGDFWPEGTQTVRLTGKFGWAAVPDDIKRLTALRTYELVKANSDPLHTITQRTTFDGTITFGAGEAEDIEQRYRRLTNAGIG